MAILCCCSQLRPKNKAQTEDDPTRDPQRLPIRPLPAKLPPPPVSHGLALSPQSTAARSSLTNPLPGAAAAASIQLGELVVEDSEDENGADELPNGSRNRSTSTLEAVKAKIRRHLSQDSLSRQIETEEQIARRAEVKRLMRKRIREELQSETDEVISSLSTPKPAGSACAPVVGNGPRDTIEFAVGETASDKELAKVKLRSAEDNERRLSRATSKRSSTRSFGKENRHLNSRAFSMHDWVETDLDLNLPQTENRGHLRRRSSLPEIPASPVLQPVRVPSFHDAASFASWRLSLSADKLADLLTPDKSLSLFRPIASPASSCSTIEDIVHQPIRRLRSKSSPLVVRGSYTADKAHTSQVSLNSGFRRRLPNSHSLVRDESPVGLWLRTQTHQFRLSTVSRPQSYLESEADFPDDAPGSPDYRLCDAVIALSPIYRRGVRIPQQLDVPGIPRPCCSKAQTHGKAPSATYYCTCQTSIHTGEPSPTYHNGFQPSHEDCAGSSSGQVPPMSSTENPNTLQNLVKIDACEPAQGLVRRGLGGLRLSLFRCELVPLTFGREPCLTLNRASLVEAGSGQLQTRSMHNSLPRCFEMASSKIYHPRDFSGSWV